MTKGCRTIRIFRCPDDRFMTRADEANSFPLGIDVTLSQAIETAVREATRLSRKLGCRVVIATEQPNGRFKVEQVINPSVIKKRRGGNPRR